MTIRISGKRVSWEGGSIELSRQVKQAVLLGDRIVVIHDPMSYPKGQAAANLVAYTPKGESLWTAENLSAPDAPRETDFYTEITSKEPLIAWNFECCYCRFDIESGKLLSTKWSK